MAIRKLRISITIRLLGYLLLAGVVPLILLGVASFDISRRIIIKQGGEFHLQQVTDLRAYFGLYADQIESLSANIAGNEAIGEALRPPSEHDKKISDSYSILTTQAQIGYILNSYVRVKGLVSIDLFSLDGRHFHIGDTLDVRDVDDARVNAMLDEVRNTPTAVSWRGIEDNLNAASTRRKVLTVTRVVRSFAPTGGTSDVVGLLVINIDANVVINTFLKDVEAPARLRLMLLDRQGRFVYHSDSHLLGQYASPGLLEQTRSSSPIQMLRLDGEEVILGVVPEPRLQGVIAGAMPRSALTAPIYALIGAGAVLLMIGAATIGLLAWRFAHQVVSPVREVSAGFARLRDSPDTLPSALPLPETKDEITEMVVGFNSHLEVLESQRVAARQLLEARQAADAANLAKSQFLATMSHEIRTPMNGILGMAQLLLMPGFKEEERQEYVRTILNSGETLLTLLNDILDLSKVEAGKLELQRAIFSPRQLIQEITLLFHEPIESKGLSIEYHWDGPHGVRYWGDPLRLRQMLANLVSNASKFTVRGKIRIDASEIKRDGDDVLLEFAVTDTGIGIESDKLDRLFKPFSQVDGSITRRYGGSGLGLSIVANLAQLMQGDTGVESEPGKGTRVWFRVHMGVVGEGQESRQGERRSADIAAPHAVQLASGYVLAVEDNPVNRKVIEGLLKRQGIRVEVAENGQEAVDHIVGGGHPALVLMDCQMPVLDGFAATEQIRAWEQRGNRSRIPIIALTAGAFDEDRERCMAAGMDDFLAKPLRFVDLEVALKKWSTPTKAS